MELPRFDAGLWLVIDTLVGLVGWAIFGTAWNEVRLGCRRVFQFTALLGLCLAAHYIWAVCYNPVHRDRSGDDNRLVPTENPESHGDCGILSAALDGGCTRGRRPVLSGPGNGEDT